ncbi:hypothetical protein [Streptomyces sp. KL116D]|uniref:hypothetical protein n=1 Tax=Streptomyces sp. KL116D TaxID=3045152 RepID=UPI00355643D8
MPADLSFPELTLVRELRDVPPAEWTLSAYRIVQEALANVVRHALRRAGGHISIAFDDGALLAVDRGQRAGDGATVPRSSQVARDMRAGRDE